MCSARSSGVPSSTSPATSLPVIQGLHERPIMCIECHRHVVDAKVAVLENKAIEGGLVAIDRQNLWEETQERLLGSRSNGTDGVIASSYPIMPP